MQIAQFTVQKKNILVLSKTAAGALSPVILTGICFLLLFLTCGQILPHTRGRFPPIHWAEFTLWMGRKLHLIGQLQRTQFARFQLYRMRVFMLAFFSLTSVTLTVRLFSRRAIKAGGGIVWNGNAGRQSPQHGNFVCSCGRTCGKGRYRRCVPGHSGRTSILLFSFYSYAA